MHPDWMCNGIDNCGDNTDEQNCVGPPATVNQGSKYFVRALSSESFIQCESFTMIFLGGSGYFNCIKSPIPMEYFVSALSLWSFIQCVTGMPILRYFPFFPLFLARFILLFHLSLSELSVFFCVHFL